MLSLSSRSFRDRRAEILYGQDRYRCQGCGHRTDALYGVIGPNWTAVLRCRSCKDRRNEVIRQRLPLIKGGLQCLR